jgi:hypothetical protein
MGANSGLVSYGKLTIATPCLLALLGKYMAAVIPNANERLTEDGVPLRSWTRTEVSTV